MAALPENYVTLRQLQERCLQRQRGAEESDPVDVRSRPEICEGNDRKQSTDGRKPESLSGKGKEKEQHGAGDIADRRRNYYMGQIKDGGGGEGRGWRRMAVPVAEGSAREQRCAGRSEFEVGFCAATSKDGWKLRREKEIVESSCLASAVVDDSNGKEVKRGECRPESSDQRQRSFKRSDSGPAMAKEDDAGGYWPPPFGRNDARGNWPCLLGRNDAGGKDDGGSPRVLAAFAEESGALKRPRMRRSDPEVRLEAQKSTIPPMDGGGIMRKAIVEDSGGNEAKSEVIRTKRGKSKGESHGKNEKDADVVGAEEGQGGGNWQRRPLKRNEDAGIGDGRRQRDVVESVAEIVALEQWRPRRLDSEVVPVDGMLTTVPHEAFHKKSGKPKQKRRGKNWKDAGVVGLEEGQGGGNWQGCPLKRNEDADIGEGRRQRDVVKSVAEIVALEQRSLRKTDSEVIPVDGMPTTVPHEAFHKKSGKPKGKWRGKYWKDAGVVGLEEGQGGGNWQGRRLKRNEDADIGDGRRQRDVVASVAEIAALGCRLPRNSDSEVVSGDHMPTAVPDVLELPPPEKELLLSVCLTGTVVEESSAKEEKRSSKETKKQDVVREKDDEDWLDNMADDVHDAPAESMKEECRGNGMNNVDDLIRSYNYQQKGFKKAKSGVARIRKEEEPVGKLADWHNMPLEAVTLPGRKAMGRAASEGKALEVNGSGYGHRVISCPRNNRFSYRERIVVGEDNETQKDFAGDEQAVNKEVEPANKNSRNEGKFWEKQKNGISSKEMVFRSDEGEVTHRLRNFSIGSSRSRGERERRLPPQAENSRSWIKGNSGWKSGGLASDMDRDMVWVKKGDVLRDNNKDDCTQDR